MERAGAPSLLMHQGSERTTTKAWRAVRLEVLARDGWQCTVAEQGERCTAKATQVHHLKEHADGGSDDPMNLASICEPHHNRITALHANQVRWQRYSNRRPAEPHPGLV